MGAARIRAYRAAARAARGAPGAGLLRGGRRRRDAGRAAVPRPGAGAPHPSGGPRDRQPLAPPRMAAGAPRPDPARNAADQQGRDRAVHRRANRLFRAAVQPAVRLRRGLGDQRARTPGSRAPSYRSAAPVRSADGDRLPDGAHLLSTDTAAPAWSGDQASPRVAGAGPHACRPPLRALEHTVRVERPDAFGARALCDARRSGDRLRSSALARLRGAAERIDAAEISRPGHCAAVRRTSRDHRAVTIGRGVIAMRVCAVSFKECWQEDGRWLTYGGFPSQMAAIASLFDEMTLVIVRVPSRRGGMP